ncbi:MAG TPA: hypothetical protein VIP07_10315 [Candidatus Limnocylindria bacterium]
MYVLLGPSLAVGVALAGFSLTRDAVGGNPPTPSAATASPSGAPLPGPAQPGATLVPLGSIGPTITATPRTPTPTPTRAVTAAPTASAIATNPPTAAPTIPPTPAPTASGTPLPTSTPPLPTLPLPTLPLPTLPLRLP